MSTDNEAAVAKVGLVLLGLLCVAGLKSCQELRYSWSGKDTTATITNITDVRGRRGGQTGYRISYRFFNQETGRGVQGDTVVGLEDVHPYEVDQEVPIQYFGGRMFTSRIKGTGSVFWVGLFVISIVGSIVALMWFGVRGSGK